MAIEAAYLRTIVGRCEDQVELRRLMEMGRKVINFPPWLEDVTRVVNEQSHLDDSVSALLRSFTGNDILGKDYLQLIASVEPLLRSITEVDSTGGAIERLRLIADEATRSLRQLGDLEELFRDLRNIVTTRGTDADVARAADQNLPEEERWRAAERLATDLFSHPIPAERWQVYGARLRQACVEMAAKDDYTGEYEHWRVVFHRAVTKAIIVALTKAKQTHPYVYLTIDGTRTKAEGPVVPWDDLPYDIFGDQWLFNQVANELMDDLLPEWRHDEKQAKVGVHTVSLDELLTRNAQHLHLISVQDITLDAGLGLVAAQDTVEAATGLLARLLACASPRQHEIWHLKSIGWTEEDIAAELGIGRGAVAAQWSRLRKKVAALTLQPV